MDTYVGVDVGGRSMMAATVCGGEITASTNAETGSDINSLITNLVEVVDDLLSKNRMHLCDVKAIGVGIPAFKNPLDGHYRFPNVDGGESIDFFSIVDSAFEQTRMVVGNDADFTCLGASQKLDEFETLKEGNRSDSSIHTVLLTLGTGIGSGVSIKCGEKIRLLSPRALTEMGHMKVSLNDEHVCRCGSRGCVEATSSCTAIEKTARKQSDGKDVSAEYVDRLSDDGEGWAVDIMVEAGRYLGIAGANIVNILNPSYIAYTGGGSKSKADGVFFRETIRSMKDNSLPEAWDAVTVVKNPDAKRYGVLGAVEYAHQVQLKEVMCNHP